LIVEAANFDVDIRSVQIGRLVFFGGR